MSKYIQLEQAIAATTGKPTELIASDAPCVSWPRYQEAIRNGDILYHH